MTWKSKEEKKEHDEKFMRKMLDEIRKQDELKKQATIAELKKKIQEMEK
jgi:hypothetical protein